MNESLEPRLSALRVRLKEVPGVLWLWRLGRLLSDRAYRKALRLQWERPVNLFQPYGHTHRDRTPQLFGFVQAQLGARAAPRILSFGCSTGEEVFSLRQYFPQAQIVGLDINARSIAVCREKLAASPDAALQFAVAGRADAQPEASFDAVFCMSVLRHSALGDTTPASCAHLITFANFDATVNDLCRCLRPGGYLILRRSNFRFCDLACAADFSVVYCREGGPQPSTPLYGPDNRLLANAVYNEEIFRKDR